MIDDTDFFPLKKQKHNRCNSIGKCNSVPGKDQYYLTEWCMYTGASLEFTYCEKCILNKYTHLKVI